MSKYTIKAIELLQDAEGDISNLIDTLKELMHFDPSLFDKKNFPYFIRNQWEKVWTTFEILEFIEEDIRNIADFIHKQRFLVGETRND